MPQSKKRHLDYTIKSARCAVAQVVGRSGFCRKDDVRRSFLLIVALFLSVCACRAQGVADVERGKRVLDGNDSVAASSPVLRESVSGQLGFQGMRHADAPIYKGEKLGLTTGGGVSTLQKPTSALQKPTMDMDLRNAANTDGQGKVLGEGGFGVYATTSERTYINMLGVRSAALTLGWQSGGLSVEARLIANRYAEMGVTNQFGVSGQLEYRLSPHWSVGAWGAYYGNNPYFSMAAFPFVETSSYGGWVKYSDGRFGLKLGAQRYYDPFQRQWKTDPIVTPSFKIGRKFVMELPVGPLVRESLETLFKKGSNNGPTIMPSF